MKFLFTMLMEQQTVTNPAVIHHWFVCHAKNIKSAMHARSGLPHDKSA